MGVHWSPMSGLAGRYLVGRYLLVDPIASGGMGSVWRVWDAQQRRYVAAKLLRPADAGSLLRFVREQSLRVVHPHVVAPLGWAAEDEHVLLTMDLVDGGSVAHLLGDYGALPLSYTAVLIDQLLDALTAVHAHGIVHRDVKPSNLLLDRTGRDLPVLRLADFGIAAVVGEPRLTRSDLTIGTPGFVAPECFEGADPDPRQDLYSAGMLALMLLAGGQQADVPREDLPEPVNAFLDAMSAALPADRPESAAAAREQWLAVIERANVAPVDPGSPDAIEVFEHVGPLPEGFGPDGPVAGRSSVPAGQVSIDETSTAEIPAPSSASSDPPAPTVPEAATPAEPADARRRMLTRLGRPAAVTAGAVALAVAVGVPLALSAGHGETQAETQSEAAPATSSTTTTAATHAGSSTTTAPTTSALPVAATPPQRPAQNPTGAAPPPVERTVLPIDDSFAISTTDKCGGADYVDHGQGAPGAANLDSVVVHDYCADGHGVKAWVKLDGTPLSSRYNGDGQNAAPVTWNPFTTLNAGQKITLSVCLVDGSTHNPPAKCVERTVALADG